MTDKPIKLLAIIARLNIGGPAVLVSLTTQKFNHIGYESILVTGNIDPQEGDMTYYATERGVEPLIVPELGRSLHPVRDLMTIWKLYRLIRQIKPDIVHTHTAKAGFVGRWAARFAGVPVVVHTFHGHVFHGYFSPTTTRVFIFLEQQTARISDTIITMTQGLRKELAETYHITRKERITVLPYGLDLEPFANHPRKSGEFRKKWNIPADAPLIGIVGRLVPVKNQALFIEAAALISKQHPNARFVIVGDGELRQTLEAQVQQLGLQDSVIFTGWEYHLAPVYADMDVKVISSVNEGTPLTVIEALSTGCPVVATAVGGIPDLLEGGILGKIVPSGDAQALSDGILEVLQNPPKMQSIKAAMIERYGLDRSVRDLDNLYRGLLAHKR